MARKSIRPRAAEIRQVVRLISECRELGTDPQAWPRRMAEGFTRLCSARGVLYTEYLLSGPRNYTPVHMAEYADPSTGYPERLAEWSRQAELPENVGIRRFLALTDRVSVRTGRDLCPDEEWANDPHRHELLLPCGIDDGLLARLPGDGMWIGIGLIGEAGAPRFGPRERSLVEVFVGEVAEHVGWGLATSADPIARLTRRQREALECLLDGDSEKQAAARLGVSRTTVHDYVKQLYHRFGVGSRAELMAYFLRRHRRRDGPA